MVLIKIVWCIDNRICFGRICWARSVGWPSHKAGAVPSNRSWSSALDQDQAQNELFSWPIIPITRGLLPLPSRGCPCPPLPHSIPTLKSCNLRFVLIICAFSVSQRPRHCSLACRPPPRRQVAWNDWMIEILSKMNEISSILVKYLQFRVKYLRFRAKYSRFEAKWMRFQAKC